MHHQPQQFAPSLIIEPLITSTATQVMPQTRAQAKALAKDLLAAGFPLFPRLPAELRRQIWLLAAENWLDYVEVIHDGRPDYIPEHRPHDKTFVLQVGVPKSEKPGITTEEYALAFPHLLSVCSTSRAILHDVMLKLRPYDSHMLEGYVYVYIRCNTQTSAGPVFTDTTFYRRE